MNDHLTIANYHRTELLLLSGLKMLLRIEKFLQEVQKKYALRTISENVFLHFMFNDYQILTRKLSALHIASPCLTPNAL